MKKVWILERWETVEELKATLEETMANEDLVKLGVPEHLKKAIEDSPDGRWVGWDGKSNYRAFCEEAKKSLRYAKTHNKDWKFRVVKAEIEDDAKFWTGYVNAIENEGVMRYLYATM